MRWLLVALLFAAGCGTGTDGTPTAPPTAPAPAPPATDEVWPEPRVCTDERERARARNTNPILVGEWDGAPFRFSFNRVGLDVNDPRGAHGRTQEEEAAHALDIVRRLAERIEAQLGYSIIEVAGKGWIDDPRILLSNSECDWREPGQIVGMVVPEGRSDYLAPGGYARAGCALWGSMGFLYLDHDGSVTHEIFHLFGFGHSLETHPQEAWQGGIAMSVRLTGEYLGPGDLGVTFEDVDALHCIFPEGG